MFDLNLFLKELDNMYQKGPRELENYLTSGVKTAKDENNKGAVLVILNELMGLYRVTNQFESCTACADEVLELSKELGIENTVNFGTVLLNVATAYRVMKRYDEALELYNRVKKIFDKTLSEYDYRVATLHNNISLLYSETGRLSEAKDELLKALDLILRLENAQAEVAITYTNLGNLCFSLHQNDEGSEYLNKAVEIFEKNNLTSDSHYASALSGLAQACFNSGELDRAVELYKSALEKIEKSYGKNEYYTTTKENLELVLDTLDRRNAMLKNSLNGLELSRRYYNMYGKPLLDGKWADYKDRITVGLVGEGSECFGFDDEYSTDHDFGPSFCLWLDSKLYDEIGEQLKADYDSLPKSFMGFRARNTIKTGVGRVGVIESGSFYKSILGYDLPKSDDDWHTIPQELLATAVNGEIFKEGSGEFLKIRNEISYYPYHIWIQKLAISLGQMAQTGQVNYKRMLKRNDAFTAELCKNEFVKASIECVYLLNKKYCPYYKWQLKGMESFKTLSDALPLIKEIITLSASDSLLEQKIEELCVLVSRELYDEHLSANCETYLENQKNEVLKING